MREKGLRGVKRERLGSTRRHGDLKTRSN